MLAMGHGGQELAPPIRSRVRVGVGAAVALLIAGLSVAVIMGAASAPGASQVVVPASASSTSPAQNSSAQSSSAQIVLFVQILGAVNRPGLYQLTEGDRAVDAVAAAGGYTDNADRTQLNLARFLSDGEQIIVPVIGAAPVADTKPGMVGGKVNLNTADAVTLETLPRVGPAMAERIIAWRKKNGRFSSVHDLLSVAGVGEKTFAELKDLVTI